MCPRERERARARESNLADFSLHVRGVRGCCVWGRGGVQELAEMLEKLVVADKLEIVDNNYTIKQA